MSDLPARRLTRRRALAAGAALTLAPSLAWASRLMPTPQQTEGPFYPDALPLHRDNDLLRLGPEDETDALGQLAHVMGRILDQGGNPIAGAEIEIWQCDAKGVYLHSGDRRHDARDQQFQGYGRTLSAADGAWRFRTLRPVPYPGRVPHIHVKVTSAGHARLTTQFYAAGDPGLEDDFVMRRTPPSLRPLITAPFEPADDIEAGALAARYDVVLGVTPADGG